jgi:hypothetical protein
LRVCVNESGNGFTHETAENRKQVPDDGCALGAVDEDLNKVCHRDQRNSPPNQQDPKNCNTRLNKHRQFKKVPAETVKNQQHKQSDGEVENKPTDPVKLYIQSIHFHDFNQPLFLLSHNCI